MAASRTNAKIKVRAPRGTINLHYGSYRAEVMLQGQRARRTFPTEDAAQQWLLELWRRHEHGISLDKSRITVAQLTDLFLESAESRGLKRTTLQGYRYCAARVKWELGDMPAQQLRPDQLSHFLAVLKKGIVPRDEHGEPRLDKDGKPLTPRSLQPKSVKNTYGFLHVVLAFGVDQEILDRNVAAKVRAPVWNRQPPKAWTVEQVETFKRAITGDRLEAMWWVFLGTGMRVGELAALKWSDIDMRTGTVTIQRRLVRLHGGVDVDTPKSRAGIRRVSLPAPVLAKLAEWAHAQKVEKIAARDRWIDGGWVFTTWKGNTRGGHRVGNFLEPRWILRRLGEIIESVGLDYLPVHGLRHTFCTLMLASNVPVKDVQEVVGHSRPSVTLDVYWQAVAGASDRVAGKAEEVLFAPEAGQIVEPSTQPNAAVARPAIGKPPGSVSAGSRRAL